MKSVSSVLTAEQRERLVEDACHLAATTKFHFGQRVELQVCGVTGVDHLPPEIQMNCSGTVAFLVGDTPASALVSPMAGRRAQLLLAHEIWTHLCDRRVPLEAARPGDLLVFSPVAPRPSDVWHIGIAVGNNEIISACDRCNRIVREPRKLDGHGWSLQQEAIHL